jgi:hypothetical protein
MTSPGSPSPYSTLAESGLSISDSRHSTATFVGEAHASRRLCISDSGKNSAYFPTGPKQ